MIKAYGIIWFTSISLYYFYSNEYLSITPKFLFLLFFSFLALVLGQVFAIFFSPKTISLKTINYNRRLSLRLLNLFLSIAFLLLLYITFGDNGFNFLEEVKRVRVAKGLDYFSQINSILSPLKYLDVIFGLFLGIFLFDICADIIEGKRLSRYTLISAISLALLDASFGGRTQLFNISLLLLFLILDKKIKITSRLMYVFVLGVSMAVLVSNSTRSKHNYEKSVAFQQLVDYNAATLVALSEQDSKLKQAKDLQFGRLSFYGFEQWGRRFGAFSSVSSPKEFNLWSSSKRILINDDYQRELNTYSWFIYLLNDFGYFGSIVFIFFLGFLFSFAGIIAHKWVPLYAIYILGVLVFLRSNHEMILATDYYWSSTVICALLLWNKKS